MTDFSIKQNKSEESLIADYMKGITLKCEVNIPNVKKQNKITDDKLIIPTINMYNNLVYNNYNISQLKIIAKNYKLKITGNKPQLTSRIYSFLYFSFYIIKIQKVYRSHLVKKYKSLLRGPATTNRKLCTNIDDFISMEPIEEINFHQFISYKDADGFIYGFDITSLHNLFLKFDKNIIYRYIKDEELPEEISKHIKNPYNRNILPNEVFKNIGAIVRLCRILNIDINLKIEDDSKHVSNEKCIELRTLSLFQQIDALGNYSNPVWFLSLNRQKMIGFVRNLMDVWNYRAQLTNDVKRNICPPNGDPFRNLSIQYINNEENLLNVRKVLLEVMEKLVNSGIDKDSKSLGACYVLGCLTLVNPDAATSLPWLYHSFNLF